MKGEKGVLAEVGLREKWNSHEVCLGRGTPAGAGRRGGMGMSKNEM